MLHLQSSHGNTTPLDSPRFAKIKSMKKPLIKQETLYSEIRTDSDFDEVSNKNLSKRSRQNNNQLPGSSKRSRRQAAAVPQELRESPLLLPLPLSPQVKKEEPR